MPAIILKVLHRVVRFRTGTGASDRLLWVMHHLIVDGVSWRILKEDLTTALTQLGANASLKLPNRTCSYQSWAESLKDYAHSERIQRDAELWIEQLKIPITPLPQDFNPPAVDNSLASTAVVIQSWNKTLTEKLLNRANACYHTQINDLLITALTVTLKDWGRDVPPQNEDADNAICFEMAYRGGF